MSDWLEIGRIVAPQGLRGEVRIYPNSDFPERFLNPGNRWLRRSPTAEPVVVELLGGRLIEGKGLFVVRFAGVETREQAEALRNSVLLVPAGDRLPLEPGEFHVADLIGLKVIEQASQTAVGTVVDVFSAGNDLLEVALPETGITAAPEAISLTSPETPPPVNSRRKPKRPKPIKPKTVLIPFVEDIVPVVNLEQGYVEITPPPGLLEA
ncbi:ribosome maturation factor RimM [Almyronema epifaneia]|uniref:Ribosome maturation factor RimM n=1 Tax=Almyronema epifaneia S1 TaxID=2991925 RepID=A0ABW6IAE6_9CYAN